MNHFWFNIFKLRHFHTGICINIGRITNYINFSVKIYAITIKVRIKLNSTDINAVNTICETIRVLAKRSGIVISGPVPLPTKRLKITTRKSPCGEGTQTWENYEMRIHKRLIDIDAEERTMRQIIRLNVSRSIFVEIELMN